ncbi:hypothetical protein MAR_020702 [Mya arenaria]|uniref:Uncharacterized protein n=1 Tax=Mya arenaria TaxID=6604 RepID=A0ABY7E9A7_MYAAR|nr:hypothetical protein MAR_020702 [Mya arenaria]
MSKSKQSAGDHELIESLRFKIKELEHEVSTLRSRLDGLRKAKNTTITKREREVVEVGFKRYRIVTHILMIQKQHAEQLAVAEKSRRDLQKQLDELYARMETERKDLKDRLEKEKGKKADNNDSELYKLRTKIAELEGDKSALMLESNDLKERVNSLCLELSVKEAKWCEREEQYKLKLKQQWGDKYAEWMAETERKIKELEETNQMLDTFAHFDSKNNNRIWIKFHSLLLHAVSRVHSESFGAEWSVCTSTVLVREYLKRGQGTLDHSHSPAKGEVQVSKKGEAHVSKKGEVQVSKKGEAHVSKKGEAHASKKGEVQVSKKGEAHVSKKGEAHVSKKGEVQVSKKGEAHVSKKGYQKNC